MKILSQLLILLLIPLLTFPQSRMDWWTFGKKQGLEFTSGSAVQFTGSQMTTIWPTATMSDPAGNLLFYTNGEEVYDMNHAQVAANLGGGFGTAHSQSLIVKVPCNEDQYYIFSLPGQSNSGSLRYTEVFASSGPASVTVPAASIGQTLSTPDAAKKITAVAHQNGRDIWVLVFDLTQNAYHAYLMDPTGIDPIPVASPVAVSGGQTMGQLNSFGDMKISPTQHRLATIFGEAGIELCQFDVLTGQVTDCSFCSPDGGGIQTGISTAYRGIEFSPSEEVLYYSFSEQIGPPPQIYASLNQLDLSLPTITDICNSSLTLISGQDQHYYSSIQRGPDDLLYVNAPMGASILPGSDEVQRIVNPDNYGGATLQTVGFPFPDRTYFGLPNFMQSYFDPDYEEQFGPGGTPQLSFDIISACEPCDNQVDISVTLTCDHDLYNIVLVDPAQSIAIGTQQGWNVNFSNLCAGDYVIQVRDLSNILLLFEPITITSTGVGISSLDLDITHASCVCDGIIDIDPIGGTPPFQYFIDGTPFSGTATNLCGGIYAIEVIDQNGCDHGVSVPINEDGLLLEAFRYNLCYPYSDCDNGVAIFPQNGTAPYTYTINGQTQPAGQNIFGPLCGGDEFNIEDANGCQAGFLVDDLALGHIIYGNDEICSSTASGGAFPPEFYEFLLPSGYTLASYTVIGDISHTPFPDGVEVIWPAASGIHQIEIVFFDPEGNRCFATLDIQYVSCRVAGEDKSTADIKQLDMHTFPNPTTGQFSLQLTGAHTGPYQAKIMDLSGKAIYSWQGNKQEAVLSQKLSLTDHPAGIYLIEVQMGEQMLHQKVLKK